MSGLVVLASREHQLNRRCILYSEKALDERNAVDVGPLNIVHPEYDRLTLPQLGEHGPEGPKSRLTQGSRVAVQLRRSRVGIGVDDRDAPRLGKQEGESLDAFLG